MDYAKKALDKHYEWKGKIEINTTVPITNKDELSIAYTPGVAAPCLEIEKDSFKAYELTRKWNMVAVITDGTSVLGLGDIGPQAAMPVMEGKCALFKAFAGVDAFPICIDSKEPDEIVRTVQLISKSFGGINLEDISAPRCFEIERRLKQVCDIPIFHDDQHGTAIVTAAALINANKITERKMHELNVVINGAGAAGIAIAKLLLQFGVKNIIMCNSKGIICKGDSALNDSLREIAEITNLSRKKGTLKDAVKSAHVFIGVSKPNLLTADMVKTMAKDPVVFAMANPVPEIMPDVALSAGAAVVGTGRSDFPNQINNVLAFPGVFKGALSVRASDITENMKMAAAKALADFVTKDKLSSQHILPDPFENGIADKVAQAVAQAAVDDNVARL